MNLGPPHLGLPLSQLPLALSAPDIENQLRSVIRESTTKQVEFSSAPGGWALLDIRPLVTVKGKIGGAQLIVVDTQKVDARTAKSRSEADNEYLSIIEAAPIAEIITDVAGEIVRVNSKAERMFGYLNRELAGMPLENLIPDWIRAPRPEPSSRSARASTGLQIGTELQLTGLKKGGMEFPIELASVLFV